MGLGLLRPAALDQREVTLRRQRRALLLDDGLGELRQRVALPGHLGREHLPREDPEGVDLARRRELVVEGLGRLVGERGSAGRAFG